MIFNRFLSVKTAIDTCYRWFELFFGNLSLRIKHQYNATLDINITGESTELNKEWFTIKILGKNGCLKMVLVLYL